MSKDGTLPALALLQQALGFWISRDFFVSVPSGRDAYTLKRVIHDWDDERAGAILRNCHRAMREHSRLLVIELVLPPGDDRRVERWRAHGRVRWHIHGFRRGPQSGSPGDVSSALPKSRVEDWRGTDGPVSSPRHIKPGVLVSSTGLSCSLRAMGYVTYRLDVLSRAAPVPHPVVAV